MELLSILAVILLTLVGYSSGNVLARRAGTVLVPRIADLLVVGALWAFALFARETLGRWPAILLGLLLGIATGAIVASLRRDPPARVPYKAHPDAPPDPNAPAPSGPRRAWERWKRFALVMGNYQGRMIMGFFYLVVVTPFAAIGALVLRTSVRPAGASLWVDRPPAESMTLEQSARQF